MTRTNTLRRALPLLGLAALGLAAAHPALAQETVGNPPTSRSNIDNTTGEVIALVNGGFTQAGAAAAFTFYSDAAGTGHSATTGHVLTPLLFQKGTDANGFTLTVTGVGQPVTVLGTGIQAAPFVLASGSAAVGPGYTFGYKDGSADGTTTDSGSVNFDIVSAPGSFLPSNGNDYPNITVTNGTTLTQSQFFVTQSYAPREYSIEVTTIAAPEPSATAALGLGLLGLVGLAARRRRAA